MARKKINELIPKVVQITGCSTQEARRLLGTANNNVQRACKTWFAERNIDTNGGVMDAIRDLLDDSEEEWDFTLPQITAPKELVSDSQFSSNGCYTPYDSDGYTSPVPKGFSLDDLVGAIQGGEALGNIRKYLTLSDKQIVGGLAHSGKLNGLVEEIPAFFYVVATLNADLVRLWAKYGGDVNITHGDGHKRVPLLAFAIAMGGSFANDSTLVVKTLLSLGAAVEVIPRALFTPLERDLPDDGLPAEELLDVQDNGKQWFTPGVQKRIVQNLNFSFSQRYVLNLASHLGSFSRRKKQVAAVYDTESLLGIHYFLIGQTLASSHLIDRLLGNLVMPSDRPLVLLFAGPSGHGKTELAQNLGRLISLDLHMVDCTTIKQETDLFGPRYPYVGYSEGSPLNNFLSDHTGTRSIVFLDEFEKTGQDIRETLLIPFQSGQYQDRRSQKMLECSRTIWILATNAFDETIHSFCKKHQKILNDETKVLQARNLVTELSTTIQKECIGKFSAPVAGRITDFIPFLTFSPCEQAAVGDKFLSELGRKLTRPIKVSDDKSKANLVGNIDVQISRGYSVCKALASQGYNSDLGARSLACEVDHKIQVPLIKSYLNSPDEIREDQPKSGFLVAVGADNGQVEVSPCQLGGVS